MQASRSVFLLNLHGEEGFEGVEVGIDDEEIVMESGFELEYEM
jgi:hypothetical protein